MNVKVYHDIERDEAGRPLGMLDGYQAGHMLVLVAEFEFFHNTAGSPELAACEEAFRLFNVGDDPDLGAPSPIAVQYRARGNRSLNVGDVVEVGGTSREFYACGSYGWDRLAALPYILDLWGTYPVLPKINNR